MNSPRPVATRTQVPCRFSVPACTVRRLRAGAKMSTVRILLTSITCEKGARDANLAGHVELIEKAVRSGCDVVAFPEFSLTGSVDPTRRPDDAIALDDSVVGSLAAATKGRKVAAVFGIAERDGDEFFITEVVARDGDVVGRQRKRHLGEDEEAYTVSDNPALVFETGEHRVGVIICAEAGVDHTWDATKAAGADIVLMCSAPGLYGRRTNEAEWRAGFEWWDGHGLGDARVNARRFGVWVGMATQAGATVDEDFPGIAALVAPDGAVVDRLPDWRPGTIVGDLP